MEKRGLICLAASSSSMRILLLLDPKLLAVATATEAGEIRGATRRKLGWT